MSPDRDPERLRSVAVKSSPLDLALEVAHTRGPTPKEIEALARSLAPMIGAAVIAESMGSSSVATSPSPAPLRAPPSRAAASAPSPAAAGAHVSATAAPGAYAALVAKVGVGLTAAALAGGSAWMALRGPATDQEQPPATMTTPPAAQAAPRPAIVESPRMVRSPAGEQAAAMPDPAVDPSSRTGATAEVPAKHRNPAAGSGAASPPSSALESEIIDKARETMNTAPARSLALANEHARRFPHGSMAQEREVIRIVALSALGRTEEARSLGSAFLAAHPGSAYARRVRRAIDAKTDESTATDARGSVQ